MPDFCTCGAQLPPDARFCHKCGKPQREEPALEDIEESTPEPESIAIPVEPPAPPAINLRNATAVRAALLATALVLLVSAFLNPLLSPLALIGGGFFAVFWYNRRTHQSLSVMNGMRLGWIAGFFVFVVFLLMITMVVFAMSQPEIAQQVRVEAEKQSTEEVMKLYDTLQQPSGVAMAVLAGFISATLPMILGAAAGAKFLRGGGGSSHHPNA